MTAQATIRERPILFSGAMVRAILEGRKTQTRRVVIGQPIKKEKYEPHDPFVHADGLTWSWHCGAVTYVDNDVQSRFGKTGDRLWVRETFWDHGDYAFGPATHQERYEYRATPWLRDCEDEDAGGWKPSIHMPRAASRLSLELTDVRVERLQTINTNDALAEGIDEYGHELRTEMERDHQRNRTAIENYALLWDSLNAKRGFAWNLNPWVWVLEFKKLENARAAA
jgi:hypothetical protein